MSLIIPPGAASAVSVPLAAALDAAATLAGEAKATATRRAYQADWADWAAWCAAMGQSPLPAAPELVAAYLAARAGGEAPLSMATLARRLVAISAAHRLHGTRLDTQHPALRATWQGLRRQRGTAQRQVAPATRAVLQAMLAATTDETLIGRRDRALLLIGYAAGLRRSELVALQVDDIEQLSDGLRLTIRRSKTDQAGAGEPIGIPRSNTATCAALDAWLAAAPITSGRLFRSVDRHGRIGEALSDKAVALIVKQRAAAAGLDPALFSGHSLRAGMITSAAAAGAADRDIQRQSRHKSAAVMQRYIRPASVFLNNVAEQVGL